MKKRVDVTVGFPEDGYPMAWVTAVHYIQKDFTVEDLRVAVYVDGNLYEWEPVASSDDA